MGRRKIWTEEKLNILYDCWKNAENTQDRIKLIEKELSNIALPKALAMMRKMAKEDTKWLKWATRKKNEVERVKLEKKQARAKRKAEVEQRRKERLMRKQAREEKQEENKVKENIRKKISTSHIEEIQKKIDFQFFFCPDVNYYVNNHSCIFRIFQKPDKYSFNFSGPCAKCVRMDKYLDKIEEVINGGQEEKYRRNTSSKGRKTKKED